MLAVGGCVGWCTLIPFVEKCLFLFIVQMGGIWEGPKGTENNGVNTKLASNSTRLGIFFHDGKYMLKIFIARSFLVLLAWN